MTRLLSAAGESAARRQIRRAALERRCRKMRVPVLVLSVLATCWWVYRTPRTIGARRLDDTRVELIVEQAGRIRVETRAIEP